MLDPSCRALFTVDDGAERHIARRSGCCRCWNALMRERCSQVVGDEGGARRREIESITYLGDIPGRELRYVRCPDNIHVRVRLLVKDVGHAGGEMVKCNGRRRRRRRRRSKSSRNTLYAPAAAHPDALPGLACTPENPSVALPSPTVAHAEARLPRNPRGMTRRRPCTRRGFAPPDAASAWTSSSREI